MRITTLTIACFALALFGCGAKEPETTETTTPEPAAKSSPAPEESHDLTAEHVVGEWVMAANQDGTEIDADIVIRDDGTFTNEGTLRSETPGEDATTRLTVSYAIDGKWKIVGHSIETTPDAVEAKVDELEIVAKDPANQAALDAQKDAAIEQAEKQMKDSLNKPSTSKVTGHTADKLTLESQDGKTIEYTRRG